MTEMFQNIQKHIVMVFAVLSIAACDKQDQEAQMPPAMPPMPVSVIEMQSTSVPIAAEVVAQTEGAKEVEIRPRVGGILLKKLFDEGASIKAGQTMFLIDPEPFKLAVTQARAAVAQQKARITQTKREASRLKSLLQTQSISQREYDNASSDQSIASANLLQAQAQLREAQLNLSYTKVKAPASGVAGRFLLSEGALVSPNTTLLTRVSQISPIWVRFSMSESELAHLGGSLSQQNIQKIELILSDGRVHPENGTLNFAASVIDPALGTQQLRAEFANAERDLLPGQFVRAKVTTGTRDGVFLVPQTAVMAGEQGKFVYVAENNPEGQASATIRPVVVGNVQDQDWVVLSGLQAGDKVVVDNLIKIRPNAPINPHPFGEPPAMLPQAEQQG